MAGLHTKWLTTCMVRLPDHSLHVGFANARAVHMIPKPNEQEGLGIQWPQQNGNNGKLQKLLEELKAKM